MTGYTDRLPTCPLASTKVDLDRVSKLDVGLRHVVRLDALLDGRWLAYRLCSISFTVSVLCDTRQVNVAILT